MEPQSAFQVLLEKGNCVIDVGAFKGLVSAQFAQTVGSTGSVYSFEPHPLHFLDLSMLASLLSSQHRLNVFPHCKAVSDSAGHVCLHVSQFTDMAQFNQASSIRPELGNKERLGEGFLQLKVESTTLDNFCASGFVVPQLIKIDCEGADSKVIRGARKTIENFRPVVVSEFGYDPNQTLTVNDTSHIAWLSEIGYKSYLLDVMQYNNVWVNPGWALTSDQIFQVSAQDLHQLDKSLLCNLIALPDDTAISEKISPFIASIGALQFLSKK